MDLSKNLWYVRWFLWSADVISEFADRGYRDKRDRSYYELHGTSLCQFMRVTLVWAPIVLALHFVVFVLVLSAFILMPAYLFGWGYGKAIGGITVLMALIYAFDRMRISDYFEKEIFAFRNRQISRAEHKEAKAPSFLKLLWLRVVSAKQKVCPTIRFTA